MSRIIVRSETFQTTLVHPARIEQKIIILEIKCTLQRIENLKGSLQRHFFINVESV